MISIAGSFNTSLFAISFSSDNNKDGNNNKLELMAKSRVMETRPPKATVPPKLLIMTLRDQGAITTEEFETKKAELLDRM